jgi:hypothetical protein
MNQQLIRAIVTCIVIATGFQAHAQLKVGVNAGVGFPTGYFGRISAVGYGAGISGEFLLFEKHASLGLSANLTSFGFKYLAGSGHTTIAPVSLLAKYYFSTDAVRPFVGIELGAYSVKISDNSNTYPGAKINPGLAPMGGFVFQLSDQVDLNLTAKYHVVFSSTYPGASQLNFLMLNLGTAITFGK